PARRGGDPLVQRGVGRRLAGRARTGHKRRDRDSEATHPPSSPAHRAIGVARPDATRLARPDPRLPAPQRESCTERCPLRAARERAIERAVSNGVLDGSAPRLALRRLTLAAIGVVYGDIGTSPLYAVRECFHGIHGVQASSEHILGVLSLVFWLLVLVVVVKYLTFVMRADNNGEGGVLSLLALVQRETTGSRFHRVPFLLAPPAPALLYRHRT